MGMFRIFIPSKYDASFLTAEVKAGLAGLPAARCARARSSVGSVSCAAATAQRATAEATARRCWGLAFRILASSSRSSRTSLDSVAAAPFSRRIAVAARPLINFFQRLMLSLSPGRRVQPTPRLTDRARQPKTKKCKVTHEQDAPRPVRCSRLVGRQSAPPTPPLGQSKLCAGEHPGE